MEGAAVKVCWREGAENVIFIFCKYGRSATIEKILSPQWVVAASQTNNLGNGEGAKRKGQASKVIRFATRDSPAKEPCSAEVLLTGRQCCRAGREAKRPATKDIKSA